MMQKAPGPIPLSITYHQAAACRPGPFRRLWWLLRSLWT